MRIIVALDSFKWSLTAIEAAEAMAKGIVKVFPEALVKKFPVADGGEGTARILVFTTGGKLFRKSVTGPLGDQVDAVWGLLGDGETAVIEMAEALGLLLIPQECRNVMRATTYGTGEVVKEALDRGARKIIIGVGGIGMAKALGAAFFDGRGQPLLPAAVRLKRCGGIWFNQTKL